VALEAVLREETLGRDDEPRGAEQKEPSPPGIPFRKHGSQPAAEDRADGDARLMKRERPASCGRPVVVSRERLPAVVAYPCYR